MAKTNVMPLVEVAREIDNFIAEQINTYEKELEVNIDSTLKEVAEDFAKELYEVTPVGQGGGKYGHLRDNIKAKKNKKGYEVNFGKKGWLSTILEFGVTYVNGNFCKHTFVRPLFERKKEGYFKRIKDSIESGGDK